MAEIELRKVHKSYGNDRVIHGVDCAIADGEFLVIVGPSGCGKSTLLRMIAGLELVTGGEISIGNRVVNDLEPAERDIAMVFQNYALYPHMTVYNNMAYGLKIRGMPKAEIEARVRKAAEILALDDDLLRRRPRQLSGGQRQRVAMGRAIVRQPSVFLFDEPLSNLDAKLRVQMRLEIKKLQKDLGITAVYVTHDQIEAMTLGHRLLVLNGGVVEQIGAPIELYEHPATLFVAGFIGSPAMNLLPARIGEGGERVELSGGDSLALPPGRFAAYAGRSVIAGIRPEHFVPASDDQEVARVAVDMIEQLGADTLVHGHFGTDRSDLTVRLHGNQRLDADQMLPISVQPELIHLFDPDSGRRLEA